MKGRLGGRTKSAEEPNIDGTHSPFALNYTHVATGEIAFMKRLILAVCLLALAGCTSGAAPAQPAAASPKTVEVPQDPPLVNTLDELIAASTQIVYGTVESVRPSRRDRDNKWSVTESVLKVDEALKGPAAKGDSLLIEQLGGTVDGVTYVFKRVIYLQPGHHYLLFLRTWPDGSTAPTAYLQSQYELQGSDDWVFSGPNQYREPFTLPLLRQRIQTGKK